MKDEKVPFVSGCKYVQREDYSDNLWKISVAIVSIELSPKTLSKILIFFHKSVFCRSHGQTDYPNLVF